MAPAGPPAYAWDWFARQRLLWREARARLSVASVAAAQRYAAVETRGEVLPMLRADYPRDDVISTTVDAVVAELAFLGRTDRTFSQLGLRNAPRGMRWWWTALTGEDIDHPDPASEAGPPGAQLTFDELEGPPGGAGDTPRGRQLTLDDVHQGYG